MNDEAVHQIVCRWMRRVMTENEWSCNHWATLAGMEATTISRTLHGERRIMPSVLTIARLAAVAGSQPDLLKGGRKPSSFVPPPTRRLQRPQRAHA